MATARDPETQRARRPLGDGDLSGKPRYSPVCTYCWWWKPSDGHYCGAWPPGGPKRIPDAIWNGARSAKSHVYPIGTEKKDQQGNFIVFRMHPDANKDSLPEDLANDVAEREQKEGK